MVFYRFRPVDALLDRFQELERQEIYFAPPNELNDPLEGFRLRDECLNAHWFRTLRDVRSTLATWREEYNCERPHSSLDYRTPQEFRQTLEGQGHGPAPFRNHNHQPNREPPVMTG